MRASLRFGNGVIVKHGKKFDFPDFDELQRLVMPVVSVENGILRCWGTAVCIGAGWFVTARHVLENLDTAGATDVFIVWETDTPLPTGGVDYLGSLLRVRTYQLHPEVDLATLTAEIPAQAPGELRNLDWSLRMPRLGEPVAVVGYSHLSGTIRPQTSGRGELEWERVLSVGVGVVLEQRTERLGVGMRQSPGFSTDAPVLAGMSGGPVIDRHGRVVGFASSSFELPGHPPTWDSYVALAGPVLELNVTDLPVGTGLDIRRDRLAGSAARRFGHVRM